MSFAIVCMEIDIPGPLKVEVKYVLNGVTHSYFIDYENITNIRYGCGTPNYKFDSCRLILNMFHLKSKTCS